MCFSVLVFFGWPGFKDKTNFISFGKDGVVLLNPGVRIKIVNVAAVFLSFRHSRAFCSASAPRTEIFLDSVWSVLFGWL